MLRQQVQPSADAFAPQPLCRLEIAAESQRAFLQRDQAGFCQTTDEGKTAESERAAIAACERQRGQDQQQAESEKSAREQIEHSRSLDGASQADGLQGLPGPRRENEAPKRTAPHLRLHRARNEMAAQCREWLAIVDLLQEIGKGVPQTRRFRPTPGHPLRLTQAIAKPDPGGPGKRVRWERGTIVGGQPLVQALNLPLSRPCLSILLTQNGQLPPFIQQIHAQFLASTRETRFDRADRPAEHLSYLDLTEVCAITQGDYPALIGVQVRQGPTQFFAIGDHLLWIQLVWGGLIRRSLQNLWGEWLHMQVGTLAFYNVQRVAIENMHQPRTKRQTRAETRQPTPGKQKRSLGDIFRQTRLVTEAQGSSHHDRVMIIPQKAKGLLVSLTGPLNHCILRG